MAEGSEGHPLLTPHRDWTHLKAATEEHKNKSKYKEIKEMISLRVWEYN